VNLLNGFKNSGKNSCDQLMNNNILHQLKDYPFDRLRTLLDNIEPPERVTPIHMQIGEPKHEPPTFIATILKENEKEWGRYPPPNGTISMRESIADWLTHRYNLPNEMINPSSNIAVVSGTREALFMAALLSVPEKVNGKKPIVLIPNPFYQVYQGAASISRAEIVLVPAGPETGFQPDFSTLDDSILDRTALAYINTPANPQGSVASLSSLEAAVSMSQAHDFVLAIDECYSEIYTQKAPPGGLSAASNISQNCKNILVFHSLSKRSNVPGIRSGFVAGDPELINLFLRLRQYGGAQIPLPIMEVSEALWRDEKHVEQSRNLYKEKFDLSLKVLGNKFGAKQPGGAFYLWLNVGDGEMAAKKLWQKVGVRVLPGKYLAQADSSGLNPGDSYIRIALVHDLDTTLEAVTRIADTLTE
tara:strand:- start:360 stop:1610 length:1251 start_codon:yes stop_codon:yes gene_type:complete